MTYRSGVQQQTEFSSPQQSSVFSQILVKHYLCDEEPVPREANQYWWNSKRTVRKKVVLPWNHPLTKETTPKLFGKKSASPRNRSMKEMTQLTELREEKPKKSERRYCCCCEENEENLMKPIEGVSDSVSDSVSEVVDHVNSNSVSNSVSHPLSHSLSNTNSNTIANTIATSTSNPVHQPTSVSVQRRVTKMVSAPETKEAPDVRRSTTSMDSGMGSFLQDLRRSQAHSVSSLSWRPSSPSSMEWTVC